MLQFLADIDEQRRFAERVPYDDYSSEWYMWWVDDFDADSHDFRAASSREELLALAESTGAFQRLDTQLGQVNRDVEVLLATPEWRGVVDAARAALAKLDKSQFPR